MNAAERRVPPPFPSKPAHPLANKLRAGAPRAFGLRLALAAVLSVSATGCVVWKDDYEGALRDLRAARTEGSRRGQRIQQLDGQIAELARAMAARDQRLAENATTQADMARHQDELLALNAELSNRLKAAGQSVAELSNEKGSLNAALADMRLKLDEMKRQQASAEQRAAQFRDLAARFQKMTDAGRLKVVLRNGQMLLELPNDVLFDSGKTALKDVGRTTLAEVAQVLRTMPDRKFTVAGHTDDVKIQSAKFPSNWELSTARAVEVVKLLVADGMAPQSLAAAGFGEFAPVAANDTPDNKARNRRCEIILEPNLEEFIKVPGTPDAAPPPPPPKGPAAAKPAPAAKAPPPKPKK
jgi:chemotaxis protein MotB